MNFGYYPGCSLHGTAKEFDQSLNEVLKVLDVGLDEINDWCCCGASSAHAMSHILSIALPARNLQLAKNQGLTEIVAPCAACYNRLKVSQHELKFDEKMRMKVEEILEEKVSNGIEVLNLIGLFQKIGKDKIKSAMKNNLKNFKVACYYGCLLVRPHDILKFDDPENPTSMEEIVSITGAKAVEWNYKVECCGASHSIDHTEIVELLSKNILDDAIKHEADIIIVACPMCHSNLDMRQKNILKKYPEQKEIPILYLTQLLGLAMDLDYKQIGLHLHYINPVPMIEEKMKTEEVAV
jgi:heterodisulfide reductase subunit B2